MSSIMIATTTPVSATMAMSNSASATSSTAASMGMNMGGNNCKISMLWNWYTVDACFISSTWQITSPGTFAGSCIGVICLVMSLAFLRRLHRTYDASIVRGFLRRGESVVASANSVENNSKENNSSSANGGRFDSGKFDAHRHTSEELLPGLGRKRVGSRPSLLQQAVRAGLHMVEFAVAYFIMLLAMYYNGYIIICILIGAFLGYFAFDWQDLGSSDGLGDATEVTGCCG